AVRRDVARRSRRTREDLRPPRGDAVRARDAPRAGADPRRGPAARHLRRSRAPRARGRRGTTVRLALARAAAARPRPFYDLWMIGAMCASRYAYVPAPQAIANASAAAIAARSGARVQTRRSMKRPPPRNLRMVRAGRSRPGRYRLACGPGE